MESPDLPLESSLTPWVSPEAAAPVWHQHAGRKCKHSPWPGFPFTRVSRTEAGIANPICFLIVY